MAGSVALSALVAAIPLIVLALLLAVVRAVPSGSSDNTLRLWDWRRCANVLSLPFASTVYEIAWSPDGARLLVAPLDGTLVRLDSR